MTFVASISCGRPVSSDLKSDTNGEVNPWASSPFIKPCRSQRRSIFILITYSQNHHLCSYVIYSRKCSCGFSTQATPFMQSTRDQIILLILSIRVVDSCCSSNTGKSHAGRNEWRWMLWYVIRTFAAARLTWDWTDLILSLLDQCSPLITSFHSSWITGKKPRASRLSNIHFTLEGNVH